MKHTQKTLSRKIMGWVFAGNLILMSAAQASVHTPKPRDLKDDTALHEELREIDEKKAKHLDISDDLQKLSLLEDQHRNGRLVPLSERPLIKKPLKRIQQKQTRSQSKISYRKKRVVARRDSGRANAPAVHRSY